MPDGLVRVNDTHASAGPEAPKSVLERVFALLDCFAADQPMLTLAQMAARTGIPRSTVHRLANVLVEQRLLERTEAGFRLGLRQFELGELVEDRRKLRDASLPSIQELFEQTHETVHLGVMDGLDVLYFVKVVGYHAFPLPTRTGGRWPMHSSALGKALPCAWILSKRCIHSGRDAIAAYAASKKLPCPPSYGSYTITRWLP